MLEKGPGSWQKIATRGHFVALFGAKKGAECFVLVIRRCQFSWSVTRNMLLIWELQRNRSPIRLEIN